MHQPRLRLTGVKVALVAASLAIITGGRVESASAAEPLGSITEFTAGLNAGSSLNVIAAGPRRQPLVHRPGQHEGDRADHDRRTDHRVQRRLNAGSLPLGIAAGPDGNLWFTDQGTTEAIGRITPPGTITEFSTGLNPGQPRRSGSPPARRQPLVHRQGNPSDRADQPDTQRSPSSASASDPEQHPGRDRRRPRRQPLVHRRAAADRDRADHHRRATITEFSGGLTAGSSPAGSPPGPTATSGSPTRAARRRSGGSRPPDAITEFSAGLNAGQLARTDRGRAGRQPLVHRRGQPPAIGRITTAGHDHRVQRRAQRGQRAAGSPPGRRQPLVHRRRRHAGDRPHRHSSVRQLLQLRQAQAKQAQGNGEAHRRGSRPGHAGPERQGAGPDIGKRCRSEQGWRGGGQRREPDPAQGRFQGEEEAGTQPQRQGEGEREVTYTPTGGSPKTQPKQIKLIKRG